MSRDGVGAYKLDFTGMKNYIICRVSHVLEKQREDSTSKSNAKIEISRIPFISFHLRKFKAIFVTVSCLSVSCCWELKQGYHICQDNL